MTVQFLFQAVEAQDMVVAVRIYLRCRYLVQKDPVMNQAMCLPPALSGTPDILEAK
jgi:hypothetical protein